MENKKTALEWRIINNAKSVRKKPKKIRRKNYKMKFKDEINKMNDRELIILAQAYKIENRINSTKSFQERYTIIIEELKKRSMLSLK